MPCIACSNKNDNICMGICLPSREQMTAELKKITPESQHSAIDDYEDIQIGDLYYDKIHSKPNPTCIETSILKAVQRNKIQEATLNFDYRETTTCQTKRTFKAVVYISDNVTEECYLLGGLELHECADNILQVQSLLCREGSEQVVLNSIGMFGGLAKKFIHVDIPQSREDGLTDSIAKMRCSNLYEFPSSDTIAGDDSLVYRAIPSKEFFSSISKSKPNSKAMYATFAQCLERNSDRNELESINPFPFELPKKIRAHTEPFAQPQIQVNAPKLN